MKQDRDKEGDEARRLWRISAMGTELAFGIIGMVLLGLGLDWYFGWSPWGVIICTLLGVFASVYNFIRQALALNRVSGANARAGKPEAAAPAPTSAKEEQADDLEFPPDFDKY